MMLPELQRLAEAWTEELSRALSERSAWAHLGTVEVASHRGTATLGGWIDRRVLPTGAGSVTEALEAWRRTPEGRIIDRAVAQANSALQARLPDPTSNAAASGRFGGGARQQRRLVALGAPRPRWCSGDHGQPWRARLHDCLRRARPGWSLSRGNRATVMVAW